MLGEGGADFNDVDDDEEENWMDTSWGCEGLESGDVPSSTNSFLKNGVGNEDREVLGSSSIVKIPTIDVQGSGDNLMSRMLLNDNKAGMEGLDKDRINQIILEASKGSNYFENEKKKEDQVNKRIEEQMAKLKKITKVQIRQGQIEADRLLEELEGQRDLRRTIVHIDMDAFYAAVEMKDDPSLKDKPMAVGGNSMLSTSNYHARKFGVRAAMPGFIGKKLCPDLVIVKPNFEKYTAVSKEIRSVLAEYDPNYCPMSLDEAYLDITYHLDKRSQSSVSDRTFLCRMTNSQDQSESCDCDINTTARNVVLSRSSNSNDPDKLSLSIDPEKFSRDVYGRSDVPIATSGHCEELCPVCGKSFPPYDVVIFGLSPEDAVKEMRSRIEQKTRLTASAGIAPNMMLAKVCSDKNKPNGQYRILPTREAVMDFIKDLPTRKISGIGKVSEKMLNAVGVHTCTDLYNQRALLYHLYSNISFNYFMRISIGIGSVNVERDSERKSMSTERTFREISKPEELLKKCEELCESLCEDLQQESLKGKTVAIKLKTVKYEVKTRANTLPEYTSDKEVIYSAARDLLRTEIQTVAPHPLRLRLMGVRMSSLLHESLCRKKRQNTLTQFIRPGSSRESCKASLSPTKHCGIQQAHVSESDSTKTTDICKNKEKPHTSHDEYVEDSECMHSKQGDECQNFDKASNSSKSANPNPDHGLSDTSNCNIIFTRASDIQLKAENSRRYENVTNSKEFKPIISLNVTETSASVSQGYNNVASDMDGGTDCTDFDKDLHNIHSPSSSLINNMKDDITEKQRCTNFQKSAYDAMLVDPSSSCSENQEGSAVESGLRGDKSEPYSCPVCQEEVLCNDLSNFNQHIDICLNRKIVMACSKYKPEDDQKSKLTKTSKVTQKSKRTLSGSPSTQKKEKNSNVSSPRNGKHVLSSPKTGISEKVVCSDVKVKYDVAENHTGLTERGTSTKYCSNNSSDTAVDRRQIVSSSQEPRKLICPVCFMEQTGKSLDRFNTHVDICLSKGTISQILQEQKHMDKDNTKRSSDGPEQPAVKRKRVNSSTSAVKTKSLDSFFKK